MEFKGTKGKWDFDQDNIYTNDEKILGDIVCESPKLYPESYENWNANAQLISKAPEMLEMINKLVKANPIHDGFHELRLEAIKLIKEATTIENGS